MCMISPPLFVLFLYTCSRNCWWWWWWWWCWCQDAFKRWLEADNVFTVPLTGCPMAMNQVAVSSITPTVAAQIADGMAVLP